MSRSLVGYLVNNRYTRPACIAAERVIVANSVSRAILNQLYNLTSMRGKTAIYHHSAKIFRDDSHKIATGSWRINAPPFGFLLPLRPEWAWLDWDIALSVLGHDAELKTFYAALLASPFRPDFFCDIGANYGAHNSALFLSAGVPAIAFEPNPACRVYFDIVRQLNNFHAVTWHAYALGEIGGEAILSFPETETWLGTINAGAVANSQKTIRVTIKRLDDVALPSGRGFVKIDTEGYELAVIRGGRTFLRERCAFFVFESIPGTDRDALFQEITDLGFTIELVPAGDIDKSLPLDEGAFRSAAASNFLARNNWA